MSRMDDPRSTVLAVLEVPPTLGMQFLLAFETVRSDQFADWYLSLSCALDEDRDSRL
jgi:hypothetical protein